MKQDMSKTCQQFDIFDLWTQFNAREITCEEFDKWYNEHCAKCMYMCETCMYGE